MGESREGSGMVILDIFLAGFHGVSPTVSDVVSSRPGQPISRCLGSTPVLGICSADVLECDLCHSQVMTDSSG